MKTNIKTNTHWT